MNSSGTFERRSFFWWANWDCCEGICTAAGTNSILLNSQQQWLLFQSLVWDAVLCRTQKPEQHLGTLESWNLVLGCTTALILRVRTFSTFHGTNLAWHCDILNWLMHICLLHARQCSGLIPDARGWLTGQTWWDLEARAGAAQSIAGFGPLFSEAKGQKKNCEQSWDTMQIVSWHGQQQFNMRHGLLLTWHCSLSCWSCPGQWDWSQAAVEKGRSRPTSAPVRPSKLSPNQQAMLQEQCAESLHFQFFLSSLQLPGSAA